GGAVTFQDPVVLNAALVTIDTTPGAYTGTGTSSGGNISFQSSLRATSAGANALTLVAGDTGGAGVTTGGDVSVTGVVGSTRLGALTISSADDVIVSAGVTADSITSTSKSFSATTLTTSVANANGGAVDINAGSTPGAVSITGLRDTRGGRE